ncbi:MAG TPA: ABC transporter substrate-binding protein [Nitriliruptorales bacterium]
MTGARRPGWGRLAAATLAVALVANACSDGETTPPQTPSPTAAPSPSPTTSRQGGTVRIGIAEPSTIDPGFVQGEAGQLVVDALFDSLVALDRDLQPVPAAASAWQMNEDATSWTFTLADATFHDGEAVTAEDFVRAFNRIVASAGGDTPAVAAFQLEAVAGYEEAVADGDPLAGVAANDDGTLTINLSHAFPDFLTVLADPALAPVPANVNDDEFAASPVGNGPFMMREPWQHGQFVRVVRFEEHPTPAWLDEVVFTIYDDDPTLSRQWEDLLGGQLDVGNVPAERIEEARTEFGSSSDGFTGPGYLGGITGTIYYFGFNVTVRPFNNPLVREAISLVMDRETIATGIMQDSRAPATGIVPSTIPGSSADGCGFCAFDPERARTLLDEAGGPALFDGPLEIVHNQGSTHEAIANAVAESITEHLGIETTVTSYGLDEYVGQLRETDIGLFRFGWTASHPSAGSYLYPLFHQSRSGLDNLSRFENEPISNALDAARATIDNEARNDAWRAVEREILERAPIAPLLFYHQTMAVRQRVHDFHRGPLGNVDFTAIWVEEG